jgi:hypothetical protein
MPRSFKHKISEISGRRKIAAYERQHKKDLPLSDRPEPINVEGVFDAFIYSLGGNKISDLIDDKSMMPPNADYLISGQNAIMELKTLKGIFCGDEALKQFTKAFSDAGSTGSELAGFLWRGEAIPKRTAKLLRKRVRRSLEARLRKARNQLIHSKRHFGNENTKCLILIALDETPLLSHGVILTYIAKVMNDNMRDHHVDGFVYLNPNTPLKMHYDGMEFCGWFPAYRDKEPEDGLVNFVNWLGDKWLKYYGEVIGESSPILKSDNISEVVPLLKSPW